MMDDSIRLPHKLTLNERSALSVSGVSEVIGFDDSSVVMRTSMGVLTVHGKQLQLKNLSLEGGMVEVEGNIAALIYAESQPKQSLWSRLFR